MRRNDASRIAITEDHEKIRLLLQPHSFTFLSYFYFGITNLQLLPLTSDTEVRDWEEIFLSECDPKCVKNVVTADAAVLHTHDVLIDITSYSHPFSRLLAAIFTANVYIIRITRRHLTWRRMERRNLLPGTLPARIIHTTTQQHTLLDIHASVLSVWLLCLEDLNL